MLFLKKHLNLFKLYYTNLFPLHRKLRVTVPLSCFIRVGTATPAVLRDIRLFISHKSDFYGPCTFMPLLSTCHSQKGEKADVFFALKACLSLMKANCGLGSK